MINQRATTAPAYPDQPAPRFDLPPDPALPDVIETLLIASWRARNYDVIRSMVNIAVGGTAMRLVWSDPLVDEDEGETDE
jgi:hypothetical protein